MNTHTKPWVELTVLRTKDGHTKTTFARTVGMSISYLSELERGIKRPNEAIVKRFADALRVPISMMEPQRELTTPEHTAEDILKALRTLRAAQHEDHTRGDAA